LVNLTGGRLWVESETGQGSTFHFTAQYGAMTAEPGRAAMAPGAGGVACLLDFHDRSRAVHQEVLESLGWTTTACGDAHAMLRSLEETAAGAPANAVVILSVRPRATDAAWREIEQVAHAAARYDYPVVLLLPADQQDKTVRIVRCKVARCLSKPVQHAELRATLSEAQGTIHARKARPSSEPTVPTRHARTILLAEDCLVKQEVAVGLLELQGHAVRVVNNGREAVDALREQAFDLVLMDVEMPELDGLEATRLIREMERDTGSHTLIVAMTAHAVTGFQAKCLEAGMDDYISKPIDPRKLYHTLERL
jgi:CheY-like chemotaxis protein